MPSHLSTDGQGFCNKARHCEDCPARNLPDDVRAAIPGAVDKIRGRIDEEGYYHPVMGLVSAYFALKDCGIKRSDRSQNQGVAEAASRIALGTCDQYQPHEKTI